MTEGRWPTGIPALDRLLGGGLETDSLTEVYGEGGTGKTILALALSVRVLQEGHWVLYIDTEGVSPHRLAATATGLGHDALERLLVIAPKDLTAQGRAVARAAALARGGERPVGLIVLDSATHYYRLARSEDDEDEARRALNEQVGELASVARTREVPVLFTNQVWRSLREGTLEPLGGSFLNHAAKTILRLDRLEGDRRRVVLLKHRALPEGWADLRITERGITSA